MSVLARRAFLLASAWFHLTVRYKVDSEEVLAVTEILGGAGRGIPLCPTLGKIQGDGRTFLDRFESYFGAQISSQSLNEVHVYRLQPKSATNGEIFLIYLSLIVSSWRMLPAFDV